MSVHVFLILLNELGKSDKSEVCRAFYLFSQQKFNITRARMLDSIYRMIGLIRAGYRPPPPRRNFVHYDF